MKKVDKDSGNLRRKPRNPKVTRTYVIDSTGHATCWKDPANKCFVKKVSVLSTYRDEQLEDAAEEINNILEKAEEAQKDQSKYLSILETPKGLFLAWTRKAVDEDESYYT